MSVYGYLVCAECRHFLWLGKAIRPDGQKVDYFHLGPASDPPNSQQQLLTRALWRFLADHCGHQLRPLLEWDLDPFIAEGDVYIEIGGDRTSDTSLEDYVRDWRG